MLCRYGQGSETIWLDDLRCTSSDVFLANCSHRGFGVVENCDHSEDVAVSCALRNNNNTIILVIIIANSESGMYQVAITITTILSNNICMTLQEIYIILLVLFQF